VGTEERQEGPAALVQRCAECGREWVDARERWRVYVTEDEPPELVAYCPDCARREFG
jgi:hypothetical protein